MLLKLGTGKRCRGRRNFQTCKRNSSQLRRARYRELSGVRVYMCTFARVRERKGKARQGKGREGKREGHGTSEQHTSPELVKETCYVRSLIQSFFPP